MFYGVTKKQQLADMSVAVCNVLGHGVFESASHMLLETCAAETHLATHRDRTLYGAGAGAPQVDESTFDWLKEKFSKNDAVYNAILEAFNVDLKKVQYRELDFSPLLSLIFARLRYRVIDDPIPADRAGRADYWKEHYNTSAGKGSAAEYLERCIASGVDQLVLDV